MKQQVRVGVLASLLMAPAVLASANEQVNQENINPKEIVEQEAVIHPLAVNPTSDEGTAALQQVNEDNSLVNEAATVQNVVEAPVAQVSNTGGAADDTPLTDIEIKRIAELKGIGEKTLTYNFDEYGGWIDKLEDTGVLKPEEAIFLRAKVAYLQQFDDLKTKAKLINDEIKLLKPTNSNFIERVKALVAELTPIEGQFKTLRDTFDAVYNKTNVKFVEEAATVAALPSYHGNIEKFLKEHITGAETLKKFEQDIQRPKAVIDFLSKAPDTTDEASFARLFKLDNPTPADKPATYAAQVQKAYDEFNLYLTSEFSTTEKQILESYKLKDGRTIKQVLDAFKKDLDAAAKVEKSITDITTTLNALTAAQFNSKMKSMLTAYKNLTDRQKVMVASYDSEVDKWTITDDSKIDSKVDLLGAYEVSSAIAALKPSNKDEYRVALFNARVAYEALGEAQTYIRNIDVLEKQEADLQKAAGKVTGVDEAGKPTMEYNPLSAEALISAIVTDPSEESITKARDAYNSLTASEKKLVNNYKTLQDWEKFAKTSLKLIAQIDKIKIEDSKAFATAVQKAYVAYDKLDPDQKKLVSNENRLLAMKPYADAIAANNALKISNKPDYREKVRELYSDENTGIVPKLDYDNYSAIDPSNQELLKKVMDDKKLLDDVKDSLMESLENKFDEIIEAEKVEVAIQEAYAKPETEVDKLKAIQDARNDYDALSANEKKIVNNLKVLTEMEKIVNPASKVMAAIDAVDPGSSTFASKAKSALNAYDKLSATLKNYIDDDATRKAKVENFKRYLALSDLVKALKSTSPSFESELEKVLKELDKLKVVGGWQRSDDDEDYIKLLIAAVELLEPKVKALEEASETANDLDDKIDSLAVTFDYEQFATLAEQIQFEYNQLSADGKKLVKKYKQFQQLKKDGDAAYKVIDLIANRVVYTEDVANAGYVKAIQNALKAYEKLTSTQKRYVYNYNSVLVPQLRIYEVVAMINALKPTSKTYIDDLNSVRLAYDALSADDKKKLEPIYYKLTNSETGVEEVRVVIDLINAATPGVEDYVKKLQEARKAYDNLARISPSYQKLVTNYKTLQDREKALKPVMDSIYQIQELMEFMARPMNDATIFVNKYNAAVKAYEKVPYESRELIHNRQDLFTTIYPVASTMEAILKIKSSSKTFGSDVRKARDWYDALSSSDKALITNYKDLLAFEQLISGGSEVDALIAAIPKTPISGYMQAIKDARTAYNALLPDEKKAVTLYKELQNYEKGVKNVLAAIDAIDNMQHATNLVSAYDKAIKALDKLTSDERQMVPNMSKLQSVGPAIEVYKQIASLKPSQDNYAGAVQAVYAAYNRLSSIEKQYVTNFAQLQEAKNNVDNLATVISKITTITPGSRDYARQVQEALALYNTLPPALKKLVTNIDMLNQSQKELTAAEKVRGMISEIDVNSANFVQKTLAARAAYDKLSSNEKRMVSNYFLLEDFEFQLGNMF